MERQWTQRKGNYDERGNPQLLYGNFTILKRTLSSEIHSLDINCLGQKVKREKKYKENGLSHLSVIKTQLHLHYNVTEIQKFTIRNRFQGYFTFMVFKPSLKVLRFRD